MARSTSALHRLREVVQNDENSVVSENESNLSNKAQTPNSRRLSSASTNTLKTFLSDYEKNFDSDSSLSSASNSPATRRNRKNWSEAEEACLISGVAKHGENWDLILSDSTYKFNERIPKDLRLKYRALINSNNTNNSNTEAIFDIRTVNEKVTEVFIGADWSRAQWTASETIKPIERFEGLLADFEKKIAAKQKMISRISPARTPSRFISSLSLNTNNTSAVKRRNHAAVSGSESSHDENDLIGTPLKKMKGNTTTTTNSPLSIKSTKSTTKSNKSNKSPASSLKQQQSNRRQVLSLHSDAENDADADADEGNLVYPDEETEPSKGPKSSNRCVIM